MKEIFPRSRAYLIAVLILLFWAPCVAAYGDTIRLKKLGVDIEGKITEMTQDFLGVAISEKDIKSVTIQPRNQQAYPDIIFFLVNGFELACKVTSINTDAIGIRIPKSEVVSLSMVFAPGLSKGGKEVGAGFKPAPTSSEQVLSPIRETEAPVTPPVSPSLALRQEIRRKAEPHFLGGCLAVFASQVAVGLHGQGAAVRHGVDAVADQVAQNLLNFSLVVTK